MNKQIFYICDICGEKFTDESQCRQHEFGHKFSEWNKKIRFFKKKQNKLVELSLSPDSIGDAEFIYCADGEAWDFLSKIFDEADCYGLDEDCGYGSKFYAYDFDFNLWYDVVQRMNEYHKILDSMNQFIEEDE